MKRALSICLIILSLLFCLSSNAEANKTYQRTAVTGGTASSLDGIDGDDLSDGDWAFAVASNIFYVYLLDADSGATAVTPTIISPTANAGTKRWILQSQTYQYEFASKYATLSAAVTAIGSTPTHLVVAAPISIGGNVTVPSTLVIEVLRPGYILIDSTYNLTVAGTGNIWAKDNKIFSITGTGKVTFTNGGEDRAAWWGFDVSATGAVNAAAIKAAIDAFPSSTLVGGLETGGKVRLHGGQFSVAPDIITYYGKKNIVIEGMGGTGYEASFGGTRLTFTVGTVGINMSDAISTSTTNNNSLKNVYINGNGVLAEGIRVSNNQILDEVSVQGCTTAGANFMNATNGTSVYRSSFSYNTAGAGVKFTGTGGYSYSTTATFVDCIIRANTYGVQAEAGQGVKFFGGAIESNTTANIYLRKLDTTTPANFGFDHAHIENAPILLLMDAETATDTGFYFTKFHKCKFVVTTASHKYVDIDNATFVDFDDCEYTGSTNALSHDLGTYAKYVHYKNFPGGHGMPTYAQLVTGNRCNKEYLVQDGDGGTRLENGFIRAAGLQVSPMDDAAAGGLQLKFSKITKSITADATVTIAVDIPVGASIKETHFRVDSALATGETWNAAFAGGISQNIALIEPVAKDTKVYVPFNSIDTSGTLAAIAHASLISDVVISSVATIALTKTGGGAFTAQGSITAIVYYYIREALPNAP